MTEVNIIKGLFLVTVHEDGSWCLIKTVRSKWSINFQTWKDDLVMACYYEEYE